MVVISTKQSEFKVELFEKNPITVSNFLRYVDNRLYDSSFFFRTVSSENDPEKKVKITVVQAGISRNKIKKLSSKRTRNNRKNMYFTQRWCNFYGKGKAWISYFVIFFMYWGPA